MAQIRVLPTKPAMAVLIYEPAVVAVAGQVLQVPWGTETAIPVPDGSHEVQIHYRYLGGQFGLNGVTVTAGTPGPLVRYKTPVFVFSRGKIRVD